MLQRFSRNAKSISNEKGDRMKQAFVLDQKLKSLVKTERKITHEILLTIQTIDLTKSYRELGYGSLYAYLTKEIGYTEGPAQSRIQAARLLKTVPEVSEALKAGDLNLSQMSMVQSAIRQEERAECKKISKEEKIEILEQLKSKNTFETQKILKQELPSFQPPKPRAIPVEKNQIQVSLQFEEKDWEKVKSLMAHFSHSVPDQKLESLLLYWHSQVEAKKQKQKERVEKQEAKSEKVATACGKKDPSKKKNENSSEPNLSQSEKSPLKQRCKLPESPKQRQRREHISQNIKVQLMSRAQEQCEFRAADGKRCESKHFLEIDHIVPLAKGGSSEFQNLRIYCRAHNQLSAKNWGISCEPY
jgi:5-methylcytosine-specific restriction endonuclease McrA